MLRIDLYVHSEGTISSVITECGEWVASKWCRRVNRERSDSEQEILEQTCSDERRHIVCMPESF